MRILAVSDEVSPFFFDQYRPGNLDGFDLILSCGDLHPEYLEFLVTMARCPLLYVHGNHDGDYGREPEGCVCVDDALYAYRGLRILGLGGAYRYREGCWLFTERQMKRRIFRLGWRIRRSGGFDILLTHAAARGVNDRENLAHRGFACFTELIDRFQPRLFIHGHIHRRYGHDIPQRSRRGATEVINACGYCVLEIEA